MCAREAIPDVSERALLTHSIPTRSTALFTPHVRPAMGGYLSFGQVAQGLYNLQEVVDQIHGRAEGRQVPNVERGIVHGHGGPMACHSVVIVSKEPTR